MQCKLTYTKMTQNSAYLLIHYAPYKSTISSWQPPRYCSEINLLQMETGCQLVPKMFSISFLSGFCPQTIYFFTVNTKYISSNVLRISVISRVHGTRNIFGIYRKFHNHTACYHLYLINPSEHAAERKNKFPV